MINRYFILFLVNLINAFPEEGHFEYVFSNKPIQGLPFSRSFMKSMYKGTFINIQVDCTSENNIDLEISTHAMRWECFNKTGSVWLPSNSCNTKSNYKISCHSIAVHNKILNNTIIKKTSICHNLFIDDTKNYMTVKSDGIYGVKMQFRSKTPEDFKLLIKVDAKSSYGYLSGQDWPLLIFYSVMCAIYALFALVWLVLGCMNWRDLLRIQFWIGAVIFLGMVEKAMFVSEYQAINNTGQRLKYPMLIAEIVSCVKRMLARILLMIVCIGYGIVKHRLGPAMKKILGVGFAYLVAALVEGYIRVLKPELLNSKYTLLVPDVVLVALDALILWWSFSYLIQTIKQMRMKHNVVKFNLYRHFSNILIIVVIASAVFMVWALYTFKSTDCYQNWKVWWINEAFWHVLFSIVLLTIVVLWRPSKNSQRYAYSPLLDDDDDLDNEEDENDIVMDNMTSGELRKPSKENQKKKPDAKTVEDDLKWIEENIPASAAEKIYPIVDSDVEITSSKLTAGKMD